MYPVQLEDVIDAFIASISKGNMIQVVCTKRPSKFLISIIFLRGIVFQKQVCLLTKGKEH